jgi:hypothetical protein
MKTYTIEVNGSELSLIIWGLQGMTQGNGGAMSLASLLDDGIEIADTDTLAAKLTAVRK